ncbi:MAG: hypothetical protein M1822_002009 [Bathelium mastoideum]|nr:MAG: hypothetical protein M1822_002009 [Bathelium mastoideum]
MICQGFLRKLLTVSTLLSLTVALQPPGSKHARDKKAAERFSARKREQTKRHYDQLAHAHGFDKRQAYSNTSYRFLTEESAPYVVTSLPDVNFEIGEMYSGLIPIDSNDLSRQLFFVFEPTTGEPVDEVTIWLNGGPGCSSLEGFFQENGRFLWQPGTYLPVENPYSWVNLTNMLWIEQPVGTGFSIGKPTATSQYDIAADLVGWFKNFQTTFGIKNFKIYVTGESYAGRYVPYVSGALVYDPCIGSFEYAQEEIPAVPFVLENNNFLNLNDSFLSTVQEMHQSCGYADFIDKYLTFPASGVQPPLYFNYSDDDFVSKCDVFDMIDNAALELNNCFDIYEINSQCPLLWDVLGFPTQLTYQPGGENYFNRTDVKLAMHAPLNISWGECANGVFVGEGGPEGEGDLAPDPIQQVLPQVIEATNRVLVGNGDYDMIIITNGTLMAIQNMTWNGQLGFQTQPSTPINITIPDLMWNAEFGPGSGEQGVDGPQGVMGIQHYERGLMWVETFQSGHMQPEFQPRVAYRHLSWLLGRTDTI